MHFLSGEVLKLRGKLQGLQHARRQSIVVQDQMVNKAHLLTRRATIHRAKVSSRQYLFSASFNILMF